MRTAVAASFARLLLNVMDFIAIPVSRFFFPGAGTVGENKPLYKQVRHALRNSIAS